MGDYNAPVTRPGLLSATLLGLAVLGAGRTLAATPDPTEMVTLRALHQQWIQDQLMCAVGDVHISYQDIKLRADQVELDFATLRLRAEGSVVLDQGDSRMSCARLDFDLSKKVGTMYDVEAFMPPTYHFRGEELERLDETHYRIRRGIFTSCTLDDSAPPWSIDVAEALIEMEGYGHFKGASLRVKGVPVLYTPRFLWPVKRDRAAGFMVPSLGSNSSQGTYLGASFFWPITRSLDTTFFLDVYSKGMGGVAEELRWAPAQNARGDLTVETLRDPVRKHWEWKLKGKYSQLFSRGYSLRSELIEMSDPEFFQAFERTFDRNTLRRLYSHVTASRVWGPQTLNLRTDHDRTFFSSTTTKSREVVLDRMPELEYRLRSTRMGSTPLYLSATGVADQLRVNRPLSSAGSLRGRYGRFDLFPKVSLLTSGLPWLNITPTVGARETYYTMQYRLDARTRQPVAFEDEALSRTYWTGGLSVVGPSVSRIFDVGQDRKLKHLVEPRVEYSYVSNPGETTTTPIFDEKDSMQVANRLRWTFANRLFYKSGETSREVASLEITQDYSFSEDLTRRGALTSRNGPVSVWLRTSPVTALSVDARADLDAITRRLQGTSLSGGANGRLGGMNLTWYARYDPDTRQVQSSQTRVFGALGPPGRPWRIEGQVAYDLEETKLLEQRYLFRWKGSCWGATAEFRDYLIKPYQNRSYRITIDLTGIGTFLEIRGGLDSGS